jgi:L-threonylcarbamoyladenylate synthase
VRHLFTDPEAPDPEAMAIAAEVVLRGGVVAYPTDTLYGLAVDPVSPSAVARLFAVKGRDPGAAIPLIAADTTQVETWAGELSETAMRLARRWWPGPLSLVVPASPRLCRELLGASASVAVRVPAHAVAVALARAVGRPVTSTSANRSGQPAAARPGDLVPLAADLDVLLDAGTSPGGAPSTVVDVTGREPRLVRAGAVPWNRVLESLRE